MTDQEILEKAYWNNLTIYGSQLSFDFPDEGDKKGRTVSIVRSSPILTKSEIEQRLVELVKSYLEK